MFYFKYIAGKYKRNLVKTIINIISVAIGLAIVLAIQLSSANSVYNLKESVKLQNGGDISISPYNENLNDDQLKVLDDLKNRDQIDYSVATWLKTACQFNEKSTNIILRFVDFSKYPFYGDSTYAQECGNDEIILSRNLAQQLRIKSGDELSLFNNLNGEKLNYKIQKVVELDNENDMDMNLFGYAFIDYRTITSYFEASTIPVNKVYIKLKDAQLDQVKTELVKVFNKQDIKTSAQLYIESKADIKSLMKSISIIGIMAVVMGGIGIASAVILNVKKEQKDICLLRTFGMKQSSLNLMIIVESSITGFLSFLLSVPLGFLFSAQICKRLYDGVKFTLHSSYINDIIFILFISMGISILFSFIPTKMCSSISPIMILRETELSNAKKVKLIRPLILIAIGITLGATFYFGDLLMILYVTVILLLAALVLLMLKLVLWIINVICKVPGINGTIFALTVQSLKKNTKTLCLITSTLLIGLMAIGLTKNISGSILPGVEALVKKQLGYDVLLTSSKENEQSIDQLLDSKKEVESFSKTLRINSVIVDVDGEDVNERLAQNASGEKRLEANRKMIQNLMVEGINFENNDNIEMVEGNIFSKEDIAKNVIIINDSLAEAIGIKCGDSLNLSIGGKTNNYQIVGIFKKQLINTSGIKIPLDALSSEVGWTSATYYINIHDDQISEIVKELYKEISDCFIVNMQDMTPSLYKTVRMQMNLFKSVSAIAIASFLLFMTNILLIDVIGRKKEFILYKVLGARKSHINFMLGIEAVIIGVFSAVLAYVLCNLFTGMFLRAFLDIQYVKETISILWLLAIGIILSLGSMLLVVPQITASKLITLLREY